MEWFAAHSAGILRGSMVNTDDTTQLVWIKYMAMANEAKDPNSGRLEFAQGQPYPIEYIAMICRKTVGEVLEAEEHFKADLNKDGYTPRIVIELDGTRVLSNWKHYQSRKDGKRLKDQVELPSQAPIFKREPISQTIQDAKEKKQTAVGVVKHTQTAVDQMDELGLRVTDKHTGVILEPKRKGKP